MYLLYPLSAKRQADRRFLADVLPPPASSFGRSHREVGIVRLGANGSAVRAQAGPPDRTISVKFIQATQETIEISYEHLLPSVELGGPTPFPYSG
ncbi:MAG: hypothetical protein JWR69_3370 [Pedosphaera sp.]|nr:hypothetical protein [Pedosphaera sp.]